MKLKKTFLLLFLGILIGLGGFSLVQADAIEDFLTSLATKSLGLRIEGNAAFEQDVYIGENLGIGTSNPTERLTVDGMIKAGSGITFADGTSFHSTMPKYMIIEDQKSAGRDGGVCATGGWRNRVLNKVIYNSIDGASLESNEFVLPAGTYRVEFSAPAYEQKEHQARLKNTTDVTYPILGSIESSYKNNTTRSFGRGVLTIDSLKAFILQHRCIESLSGGDDFGSATGFGTEVYSQVFIEKMD